MKAKKIRSLVEKARSELTWEVQYVQQESEVVRILSDPVDKVHFIVLPPETAEADPAQDLLYLHELGHALLCERVHPFFGSIYPVTGLEERMGPAVRPVLNAAGDWFVGQWQMEFCHDLAMSELHNEFLVTEMLLNKSETPSVEKFFVMALIVAQSIQYLHVTDNCSGFLKETVAAILAVPPENPSMEKMLQLINGLLELGAPLRCRKVFRDGRDQLEFYPPAKSEEC